MHYLLAFCFLYYYLTYFQEQWHVSKIHSLQFCLLHWPLCSFIADTNLLKSWSHYSYHTEVRNYFSLYFFKYSCYQKMFKIKVVDLTEIYILSHGSSLYSNWLQSGWSGFGGSIPSRDWEFFSSPHPDWLWGLPSLRGSFLGVKWLGHEAEVKNAWHHTSTPNTSSWCGA